MITIEYPFKALIFLSKRPRKIDQTKVLQAYLKNIQDSGMLIGAMEHHSYADFIVEDSWGSEDGSIQTWIVGS